MMMMEDEIIPVIKISNDQKYIDGISIYEIIKKYNSPIMIFNGERLKSLSTYLKNTFKKYYSNTDIHYAIKACYTPKVIEIFLKNEIKLEVMSEFEYKLAKKIGANTEELILNGPGKTNELLKIAIKDGVKTINVDSEDELEEVYNIAKKYNKVVKIGLRVQPDVPEESFLKRGEKLGVDEKTGQAEKIVKMVMGNSYLKLCGIQFHSFINQKSETNIVNALEYVIKFILEMKKKYNFKPEYIDMGGGFATIDNWKKDGIEQLAKEVSKVINKLDWKPKLILEPGRFLVSDCAVVIAQIVRKKMNGDARWIIVNANTNMLIPLASADFRVENLKCDNENLVEYNVGDCLCSASGTIERNVLLSNNLKVGDYIIIKNVGSYTVNLSEPFAEPIMPILLITGEKIEKIHNGVNIEAMLDYFLKG